MQSHPGNLYDGQTLAPALAQVERLTGTTPERCYVDRGYRGHKVEGQTEVFVPGRRRGITATIRRELRRRSAIEAMVGHMKLDGKLGRNHLKAAVGDAVHALLCGAGHNLRLILRPAPPARCAHSTAPRRAPSDVKSTSSEPTN